MIRHLDSGLAAYAKFALADRVCGIAFEFFRETHFDEAGLTVADDFGFPLHDSNEYSTARRAQGADARFPGGDSRDDLFLGNEANDVIFRIAATCERCTGAGCCGDFYKLSA